jgi:hypothetical protein
MGPQGASVLLEVLSTPKRGMVLQTPFDSSFLLAEYQYSTTVCVPCGLMWVREGKYLAHAAGLMVASVHHRLHCLSSEEESS